MVVKESTRETFGKVLVELGRKYPDIVAVGGDLNKSTFSHLFGQEFPDRFFDFGPAEQNIMSVAAGLAASGKIPIANTFAVFATCRPYDQIRIGIAQPRLNVKIVATHSGIITGEDGISAHGIEDVAIMCALPKFNVVVPADAPETSEAIRQAIETEGPFYIRLSRPATPIVHGNECRFVLGRAEQMRDGRDLTIIACGIMVWTSIEVAKKLFNEGIHCRVVNMHTLAPLDEASIVKAAHETGAIVTAEEHYMFGGLSSQVAHVLAKEMPVPMETVALTGYAESGKPEELLKKYGLSAADVEKAARKALARKKS